MSFFDRLLGRQAPLVQELVAEVAIGDEFKAWAQSDIGRYIIGRAELHELATLRELSEADPKDLTKITALQSEARAMGLLVRWIEEAMFQGEQAKFQLDEIAGEL